MPTREEIAAIHKTLSHHGGDRAKAAAELGLTGAELRSKIVESEELNTLWGSGGPAEIDTYDRERPKIALAEPADFGLPEGISPKDSAIADSFARQEIKLQKFDWEGLGVTDQRTVNLMRQFEQGVGRGVVRMLDAMCGGMGFCFAQVSARFAFAAERLAELEDVKAAGEELSGEQLNQYAYWHQMFMNYAREMKGFNKEATNAAHTRLLIADRARKMQAGTNKMKRPGWRRVASTDPNANGSKVSAAGGAHG